MDGKSIKILGALYGDKVVTCDVRRATAVNSYGEFFSPSFHFYIFIVYVDLFLMHFT